jgi:hypothetical protein
MTGADSTAGPPGSELRDSEPLSRIVDWATAAALVLGGLLSGALGAGFYALADRDRIAELVADGTITSDDLTDAELIDVTHALLTWGGIGLAAVALLLVVAGLVFLVSRTRARRDPTRPAGPDSITLAIVGAVVTIVASFVPLSPILGGVVAGYLQDGDSWDGAKLGAYAGLVAAVPLTVLGLFVLGGLAVVTTELGLGAGAVLFGLALVVFALLASVVYLVGLSALGGYFGVAIAEHESGEQAPEERGPDSEE